jgi:hypothetical protein
MNPEIKKYWEDKGWEIEPSIFSKQVSNWWATKKINNCIQTGLLFISNEVEEYYLFPEFWSKNDYSVSKLDGFTEAQMLSIIRNLSAFI